MTAKKVLAIARGEIGAISGVKYNNAIGEAAGAPYCCTFLWWCFRGAEAAQLFYGGGKTSSCITLLHYHQKENGLITGPLEPGDIVFFDWNKNNLPDHVGIVEQFSGTTVTTIEGNTSENGSQTDGGRVLRKSRRRADIRWAYRPRYKEEAMTFEEFSAMMEQWLAQRNQLPPSDWAAAGIEAAKELGITDGTRPRAFMTREEGMQLLVNAQRQTSAE